MQIKPNLCIGVQNSQTWGQVYFHEQKYGPEYIEGGEVQVLQVEVYEQVWAHFKYIYIILNNNIF